MSFGFLQKLHPVGDKPKGHPRTDIENYIRQGCIKVVSGDRDVIFYVKSPLVDDNGAYFIEYVLNLEVIQIADRNL
jgi:hypothetical protein